MDILIGKSTKVICQGFVGKNGTCHPGQTVAASAFPGDRSATIALLTVTVIGQGA